MTAFSIAAVVALAAALMTVTRPVAMHALLYLVVSLLATAVMFVLLGAPFAAALEVIVYAGAIVILIVFVVMLVNVGPAAAEREREWMRPSAWVGPALLAAVLAAELGYLILADPVAALPQRVAPADVGGLLFGHWVIAAETAGFLLLAGLVGAFHLGRRGGGVR